jgi:hypothetical protein
MRIIKVSSIFRAMSIVQLLVLSCIVMIAASAVVSPFSLLLSSQSAFAQQASFDNPIPLDNGPGDQVHSHVAASDGNNVYVAYTSEINGQSSILFTRSTDRGASFSTPISVSNDQASGSFSFLNAIAANGNNVYVVWTRVTNNAEDIYLAKSTDGGVTFSNPIQVESGGNGRSPAIAVSGNNVYVVWQDFTTSPSSLEPEIFFSASIDAGATFSAPIDISNTAGPLSKNPSIAANGNNVYVVWADCSTNSLNCRISYAKSNNVGDTFTTPVTISDLESSLPDVAVLGNTVYVVYGRSFPNSQNVQVRDVFLIKGTDTLVGGTVFGSPVNLSNDPDPSNNPRIDISGSNVAIQWENFVRGPSTPVPHWEVIFAGSTDGGITFGSKTSVTGSRFPTSDSTLNDIAISGSNLYSTWTVFQDNSFDVYFARGTLTPITPIDNIPPDTIITSAVDGNNVRLNNGDSTDSNKITFTFTGTDNVAVAGFECRLDSSNEADFAPCTSPITYNNLNAGVHTFEVRAIDTSGNKDPTPASFSWKILVSPTGEQEAPNLICTHPNSKAIC